MSNPITWGYIARHLPMITVQCNRCGRRGRYSTGNLVATFGADAIVQVSARSHKGLPAEK